MIVDYYASFYSYVAHNLMLWAHEEYNSVKRAKIWHAAIKIESRYRRYYGLPGTLRLYSKSYSGWFS